MLKLTKKQNLENISKSTYMYYSAFQTCRQSAFHKRNENKEYFA